MQRRSPTTPSIPRRSARIYAVVTLTVLGLFVLLRQNEGTNIDEPDYHPQKRDTCGVEKREEERGVHMMDEYVKDFPKLRGHGNLGFPSGLKKRDEVDEGDEYEAEVVEKTVFDWPRTNKLFVFGDSYSTIDSDYRTTGVDGGHHERFHHKATDMKWADYLYTVFQDFHILQYYNFARPGAVIDPVVVPPGLEKYGTFVTQVEEFEDLFTPLPGPNKVNWHGNDSLFVVFFGINDMGRMNREDIGRQDIDSTTQALAKSLINSCRRLEATGARSFLIVNVPPLEHSPKYSQPNEPGIKSHDLIAQSVKVFNSYLKNEVNTWKEEEGDKNVMLFDLEKYWRLVLAYPEAFGMTDCARYQMWLDDKRPNLGRMGYCYHDNQHISWSGAELIARNVHGFLLRHSMSFQGSNATYSALYA